MIAAAEMVGVPLLVKPAAGGGGKGMRTDPVAGRAPGGSRDGPTGSPIARSATTA